MKKLTKPIITAILTAALLITSIGTGSFATAPVTVNAATTTIDAFKNGSTVTIKTGDSKKLTVTDSAGNDIVPEYKWRSSDTNIAKVATDFIDETQGYDECVIITAVSSGTATITGTKNGLTLSVTVTVKLPAPTNKQKKCKHKYKVTKKATCERNGVKTCKKCKYQKEIGKVSHKYVDATLYDIEYDGYYHYFMCTATDCPDRAECEHNYVGVTCPHFCGYEVRVKYDKDDNVTPDSEYKNRDEAINAVLHHNGKISHGMICDRIEEYGVRRVTKTVKACKWCGTRQE